MANTVPCPNPICTHQFARESIKGVSRLICPSCGTAFEFGASQGSGKSGPATPRPPARPAATTPRPPTVSRPPRPAPENASPRPAARAKAAQKGPATPMPPLLARPRSASGKIPMASPVEASPANQLSFDDSSSSPRRRRRRRGGTASLMVRSTVLMLVLTACSCALFGLWWWLRQMPVENQPANTSVAESEIYSFPTLPAPWKQDLAAEKKLRTNLLMKKRDTNNCMALLLKDYKTRLPSEAEMTDEALGRLRGYFKNVEWERKPKAEDDRLGGEAAARFEFEGLDPDNVAMNGECLMMAYRGFGFWMFNWAPVGEREQLQPEWANVRRNLTLNRSKREGWQEIPRPSDLLPIGNLPYQIGYVKEVWSVEPREGYDPLAEAVLTGHDPNDHYAGKAANFQAILLPKAENLEAAVTAAKAHLTKRPKAETPDAEPAPEWKVTPIKEHDGSPAEHDLDFGGMHGHVSRFELSSEELQNRYVTLGVVNQPQGVVALVCSCDSKRRDFWEQEFEVLIKSLRPLKKKH